MSRSATRTGIRSPPRASTRDHARLVVLFLLVWAHAPGLRAQEPPADSFRAPGPPVLELVWLGERADQAGPERWAAASSYPLPTRDLGQIILRLGQVRSGLVLRIEVPAREADSGPRGARVHLRIRDTAGVRLPPVGWGHQFGFETLADIDDCDAIQGGDLTVVADCRDWYASQADRRRGLERLLSGEWEIELGRRPAIRRRSGALADLSGLPGPGEWSALAPSAEPRVLAVQEDQPGARRIDILFPWGALPPVRTPKLEALAIDVASAHSLEASRPVFRPVIGELGRPLARRVTACGYSHQDLLLGTAEERSPHLASPDAVWLVRPDTTRNIDRVFALDHEAHGYQYTPDPDSPAPALYEATFFEQGLGDARFICGPRPATSDGIEAAPADALPYPWLSAESLALEPLEDGRVLVWQGPRVYWTYFGSGQCGACARVDLHVLEVGEASGTIRPAFTHSSISDGGFHEVEYGIARDRSRISVFESAPVEADDGSEFQVVWTRRDYCRTDGPDGIVYDPCGEEAGVPEPPSTIRDRIARLSQRRG